MEFYWCRSGSFLLVNSSEIVARLSWKSFLLHGPTCFFTDQRTDRIMFAFEAPASFSVRMKRGSSCSWTRLLCEPTGFPPNFLACIAGEWDTLHLLCSTNENPRAPFVGLIRVWGTFGKPLETFFGCNLNSKMKPWALSRGKQEWDRFNDGYSWIKWALFWCRMTKDGVLLPRSVGLAHMPTEVASHACWHSVIIVYILKV